MSKRLLISLIGGAVLGVVCILGAQLRFNGSLSTIYLFSFWFNRVLIGLVIGVISTKTSLSKRLIRGAILGLIVSFAFYSSTNFLDLPGFLVGALYGIIIEYAAFKLNQ